jgi:hypothetical protein
VPLAYEQLPPPAPTDLGGSDIAASSEWFGDGHQSYRQILMRRELAELIVAAGPKDFKMVRPTREV